MNYEFFFGAVDSQPAFQGFAGKVPATFRRWFRNSTTSETLRALTIGATAW